MLEGLAGVEARGRDVVRGAERLTRQFSREPSVERTGGVAEHAKERAGEIAILARGHAPPKPREALLSRARDEPLQKGGPREICHRAPEVLRASVQLGVGRKAPLEREL